MKKIVILILCCIFTLFIGCVNVNNKQPEIENKPSISLPLPDDEMEEEKKKSYISSKVNSLRIRTGAGSNYSTIGYLDKNDMVLLTGEQGNYYKTIYKEKIGYLHKDYCEVVKLQTSSAKIEKAIDFGSSLLGYPYVWGSERYHWGNGKLNANFENGKFDCSAFVQYIYYITNGVILDVTSRTQSLNGELVKINDLRRGDLMFFTNQSRKNYSGIDRIGHVAIYIGYNYILHTASDHAVIEQISSTRWSYFECARRVV